MSDKLDDMEKLFASSIKSHKQDEVVQPQIARGDKKIRATGIKLTDEDTKRINEILDNLYSHSGERGKLIDAIRMALDTCPKDGKVLSVSYKEISRQDGRRKVK